MAAVDLQNSPLVKQLAANDRATREKAVLSLRTYLLNRPTIAYPELLKLWKGLFYCMWLCDRPKPQQRLAQDLAGLVDVLKRETFVPFVEAFFETMKREWRGIDVLRMNKFLYLVRCIVGRAWTYLGRKGWEDAELLRRYLDALRKTPLEPRDGRIPNGLRYHLIDIYLDELDKVDEGRSGKMPLDTLLEPLKELSRDTDNKVVRQKVKEALEDERLTDWNDPMAAIGSASEEEGQDDATDGDAQENEDDDWAGIEE